MKVTCRQMCKSSTSNIRRVTVPVDCCRWRPGIAAHMGGSLAYPCCLASNRKQRRHMTARHSALTLVVAMLLLGVSICGGQVAPEAEPTPAEAPEIKVVPESGV